MTLDQFLAFLETRERGRGWVVDEHGQIRRERDDFGRCCPLTAAHNEPCWSSVKTRVVSATGRDLVVEIMDAADRRAGYDRALRARLCAALGLVDTTTSTSEGPNRHGGPNQ